MKWMVISSICWFSGMTVDNRVMDLIGAAINIKKP